MANPEQSSAEFITTRNVAILGYASVITCGLKAMIKWMFQPKLEKHERFVQVPGLPFFGVWFQLGPGPVNFYAKLKEFGPKFGHEGAYEMTIFGRRVIVLCSMEARLQFASYSPKHIDKHDLFSQSEFTGGCGFSNGQTWARERRFLAPHLSLQAVRNVFPNIQHLTQQLAAAVAKEQRERGTVNFTKLFISYSIDVLGIVALGVNFNMLETGQPHPMYEQMRKMWSATVYRAISPFPFWKIPFFGNIDGYQTAAANFLEYFANTNDDEKVETSAFGEKLRHALATSKVNSHEALDYVKTLEFAGHHPPATLLMFAFYHLAKMPELQKVVAEELMALPAGIGLEEDQVNSLVWTRALYLECLRMHMHVFSEYRTLCELNILGRRVPAGTSIFTDMFSLVTHHYNKTSEVGTDLTAFRPSRWVAPDGSPVHSPDFETVEFGFGARRCPGIPLTSSYVPLAIATLLQRFELEAWTGPQLTQKWPADYPSTDVVIGVKLRAGTP